VPVSVALLRAVNVGGTGMLPMQELRTLCTGLGLTNVRTYIQSGNVVFESRLSEAVLRTKLEAALSDSTGHRVSVMVRTASELRATLDANPFPDARPAQVGVVFLAASVPEALFAGLARPGGEELRAVKREVFIHYPNGMGRSKLKLPPAVTDGTTRNLNTVAKLVAMAEG
jgi:uncharacterized protein (DUF1697 family)